MDTRRAWLSWGVGVFAYVVAICQRTSFGVAGLDATERFNATAAALSAFSVLQLLVYAALQIPVGALVDRFGPKLMVSAGALLMLLGQLQLAAATSVPAGLVGRVLLGAGDAMTFIAVLRLLPAWFSARRIPLLTQLTAMIGQLGQLLSAIPFAAILHQFGWSPAFVSAAALSLLALVLTGIFVRDYPADLPRAHPPGRLRDIAGAVAAAWRQPGTRLGMWSHFTLQFSGTVFLLTWGYPFLVSGQGLPPSQASLLLTLFIPVGLVSGPWLGGWVGRHPLRRSTLVLVIAILTALVWALVLLYPGPAPLWLLIVLIAVLGVGGPAAMIGFDFARTFNPAHRMGTATGIVNVGGFIAALITMYIVGLVLDLLNNLGYLHGMLYALDSFRIALSVQFLVIAFGVGAVLLSRREVRRRMASDGVSVPPLREALSGYRARRRRYQLQKKTRVKSDG